ncbi:hypothetical protein [Planococcus sp. ISL-110]|uniref:hypothetical protein n=1 Tax=Planococcus sp. ISL-110 TaxID=2819167 RepID=UPI001BE6A5BF|nr:hypothetical protein [Planococcus sp. ISL-110]MBT2570044.1 hypothetical protein [Planococcus sp. ISL-110]
MEIKESAFIRRLAHGRAGAEKCSKKEASLCISAVYIKDMEQNSGDARGKRSCFAEYRQMKTINATHSISKGAGKYDFN